ncbi:IAA-amino acid hydrolase ILR1-like 3 [Platanthera guangdongensis]|uniref:IAA-amino acid hydrolase ILR1-like 3 n=1 Tax=Platanthera guangdongensis TaxID=2320717 RepID=A0ABR2M757_9ASPA
MGRTKPVIAGRILSRLAVIEKQAAVHQCTAAVDFMEKTLIPYPATVNDERMYAHAKKVAEDLVGETNVRLSPLVMGAEDFSFYTQKMPSAVFNLGVKNESIGLSCVPHHNDHAVKMEIVDDHGAIA